MKRNICLTLIILLLIGFGCTKQSKTVIKIDNISISSEEFEAAFEASRFASMGDEGKKAFLDSYISSKLILKEAESLGLDKDPQFLRPSLIVGPRVLKGKAAAGGIAAHGLTYPGHHAGLWWPYIHPLMSTFCSLIGFFLRGLKALNLIQKIVLLVKGRGKDRSNSPSFHLFELGRFSGSSKKRSFKVLILLGLFRIFEFESRLRHHFLFLTYRYR